MASITAAAPGRPARNSPKVTGAHTSPVPIDGSSIYQLIELFCLNLYEGGGGHPAERAMDWWRWAKRRIDQLNPAPRAQRGAPDEHRHDWRPRFGQHGPTEHPRQAQADEAEHRTRDRADDSHPELGLRICCFLLDLRHAAKRKERNRTHRQAPQFGDQGMRELMRNDGGKEKRARDDRRRPSHAGTPLRVHLLKTRGK